MPAPWSSKGEKSTIVDDDEFMILDSEDAIPATQNKRVTMSVVKAFAQTPWVADIDANGFDLTDLSNIEFRETTGAPAGSVLSIYADADGITTNVPDGDTFSIDENGITKVSIADALLTATDTTDTEADSFEVRLQRAKTTGGLVVADDSLGKLTFFGGEDATPTFTLGGKLEFLANETWADTDHGTRFELSTTTNGADTPTVRLTIGQDGTSSFEENSIDDIGSIGLLDSDQSNTYTIQGDNLAGDFNVTIPTITANDIFALLNVANTFTQNQTITFADDIITNGLTIQNTFGSFAFGNGTGTASEFLASLSIVTAGSTSGFTTNVTTPAADDTGTSPLAILNLALNYYQTTLGDTK